MTPEVRAAPDGVGAPLPGESGPPPSALGGLCRRILGVDPGLASTGWGVLDSEGSRLRYVAHGCIETRPDTPRAERLLAIYEAFRAVLAAYQPQEAAIENLYFGKNTTSAMAVAEARGVLCMALAQAGVPVLELTPAAIKKAVVGESAADKAQVQEMVRLVLGLSQVPSPHHAADALSAAVCGSRLRPDWEPGATGRRSPVFV